MQRPRFENQDPDCWEKIWRVSFPRPLGLVCNYFWVTTWPPTRRSELHMQCVVNSITTSCCVSRNKAGADGAGRAKPNGMYFEAFIVWPIACLLTARRHSSSLLETCDWRWSRHRENDHASVVGNVHGAHTVYNLAESNFGDRLDGDLTLYVWCRCFFCWVSVTVFLLWSHVVDYFVPVVSCKL
jgi:hypothetical protein